MPPTIQIAAMTIQKRASDWCIAFILASVIFAPLLAGDPPKNLASLTAQREAENEQARSHYMYRQTVLLEEMDPRNGVAGTYHEVRDVIFSPEGERTEQAVGKPMLALKRLKMTDEDFRDLREVQPFLFTPDQLFLYETKFRGEETMEGVECWLLQVAPRQILQGQRLFEGLFWIAKSDYSIVRSEGRAVPQILRTSHENLFPRFTTIRHQVDGMHWFPIYTHADDTLPFRTGALRVRMKIQYSDYKRFGAESNITFEKPQ